MQLTEKDKLSHGESFCFFVIFFREFYWTRGMHYVLNTRVTVGTLLFSRAQIHLSRYIERYPNRNL